MELSLKTFPVFLVLSLLQWPINASYQRHEQWISLQPWQIPQPAVPSYDYYSFDANKGPAVPPENHQGIPTSGYNPKPDHGPAIKPLVPNSAPYDGYHSKKPLEFDLKPPKAFDVKPHGDPSYLPEVPENHGYDLKPAGYDLKPAVAEDVMVDVINDLGINLLAIHNENNDNNIALSPYGAISVLAALSEGLRGEAVHEILHAAHLPKDRHVVRVGLRDIHRHLKSYFIPPEGFLAGLTLNLSNVTLRTEYEDVLKFYGFDYGSFNNALYPEPQTTTLKPAGTTAFLKESTDSISKATQLGSRIGETATESTTNKDTTPITEITTKLQPETTSLNKEETTTEESIKVTTSKVATDNEKSETIALKETTTPPLIKTTSTDATTTVITEKETTSIPTTTMVNKVEETTTPTTKEESITMEVETTTKLKEVATTEATTLPSSTTTLPSSTTTLSSSTTTLPSLTTMLPPSTEPARTTREVQQESTTIVTLPVTTTVASVSTVQETTVISEIPTGVTETTVAGTTDLTNSNAENQFNMLPTTVPPPFFDDSQTATPFFIGTMPDIPQTTALPPQPNFDYYNYQDVNAPIQPPTSNYEDINPGLINNMAVPPQPNLSPTADTQQQPNLQQPNIGEQFANNNNLNKRHARSVPEYVHQRGYLDIPHRSTSGHYLHEDPKTFSVYGKYREPGINFMKYDTVLPFAYLPNLNSLALSFPLDSSRYYLLLLLPVEENGIDQLICDLRLYGGIKYIVDNLRITHVVASIPSFMLKGYVSLTPTLQKLGVRDVFEPRRADFSPMTDEKNIYVTNIEQAVTVTIRNYLDPAADHYKNIQRYEPVYFTADHPFLYFVLDSDLNVALMVGKVVNPLNSRIR